MNVREHQRGNKKNGQSRETGNTGHSRHRTKIKQQKTSYADKHKQYKQDTSPLINNRRQRQTTQTRHESSHKQQEAKTNNTNKTRALS